MAPPEVTAPPPQQQYAADQKAAYEAKRATYNRAYSVYLEGRGYTVK